VIENAMCVLFVDEITIWHSAKYGLGCHGLLCIRQ